MPSMPMQPETADQVMAELGLTDDLTSGGAGMSMDQTGQLDATANANFTSADIEAALNQPAMDLGNGQQQSVPGLPSDPSEMQNPANDIFSGLNNVDLSQPVQNPEGSNGGDDDIFAGLNMDLGDDVDFDFS